MAESGRWTQEDLDRHLARLKVTAAPRSYQTIPEPPPAVSMRPRKYRSQPTEADGILFDSKKESARYLELTLLERVGAIRDLLLQPRFDLIAYNGEIVGKMTLDFQYFSVELGRMVYEDVKSTATKTTAYRLRKRLCEASHGFKITEV